MAANVVPFLLNEISTLKQMQLFLSALYVIMWSLIAVHST